MGKNERVEAMLTFSRDLYSLAEKVHQNAVVFKYEDDENTTQKFEKTEKLIIEIKKVLEEFEPS